MEKLYNIFEIAKLIAKEKIGTLSDVESEVLQNWLAENDRNTEIYNKLQNEGKLINGLNELKKLDAHKAFQKVEQIISKERHKSKIFSFIPNYIKYAAAVAVLVVSSYFIIHQFNKLPTSYYTQNSILPGKQKAILITANNQKILLDSSNNLQIIKDESVNIVHSGSTLNYNKNESIDRSKEELTYNMLITPLGSEYKLILSDGTEVMLNAGSKLKYPVVFNDKIREVELEGEAFFKVIKSNNIPFIVKTNNVDVTVYGTTYNVLAYNNDSTVQTTLVEGSVGVSINRNKTTAHTKIRPGQQFIYNKSTGGRETKEVNTERFIAWTKGMFVFENEPIENILKTMSRWYDFNFEIKDENLKKLRFTLSVGRNDNVTKILDMISTTSHLKFSTKGNSIIVYTE